MIIIIIAIVLRVMKLCESLFSKHNITSTVVGATSVWRCAGRQEWRATGGKIRRDRVIILSSLEFILSEIGTSEGFEAGE